MFCSRCGSRAVENAKYCSNCGLSFASSSASPSCQGVKDQEVRKTVSFDEFKKRKENERSSRFQPKVKKSKTSKAKSKVHANETSINIGFMKLESQKNLKRCRGKTLPVKVSTTANAHSILEKGVKKHSNHDKKVCEEIQYVLLYPDCSEVINLPGTNEPFVLEKYREDVGKAYNRITLFIAKKTDYIVAELPSLEDSESDNDEDLELPNTQNTGSVQEQARASTSTDSPNLLLSTSRVPSVHTSIILDEESPCSEIEDPTTTVRTVECPTCFKLFPIDCIADHADLCIDDWVGEVDSSFVEVIELVEQSIVSEDGVNVPKGRVNSQIGVTLRDLLFKLVQENTNIGEEARRIHVRRKSLWEDFKTAKKKLKLTPSNQVRFVFLGEPAVDDGGPKREFFSGLSKFYS